MNFVSQARYISVIFSLKNNIRTLLLGEMGVG